MGRVSVLLLLLLLVVVVVVVVVVVNWCVLVCVLSRCVD